MARRPATDDHLERLISEIHTKLDGAAFNGGFESLVKNVENIEQTQTEILSKLDEMHKVIYEPDEGLFARVKKVETTHSKEIDPLKRELEVLNEWKASVTAKDGPIAQMQADKHDIQDLISWKKRFVGFLFAAVGSTLLMVIKTIYEFVRDHISLH